MSYTLSPRSIKSLAGVHPDLIRVVKRALTISPIDFVVIEGRRTVERQKQLVEIGASRTMNSRHITGHAIDVCPLMQGEIRWDWPLYKQLAPAFKQAASEEGVPLEWGGDWRTFRDGPHFQLPHEAYPAL